MVQAKPLRFVIIALSILSLTIGGGQLAHAQEEQPQKRQTTILVDTTQFEWWLNRWTDSITACQVFIEHEGYPTPEEIFDQCGEEVYDQWIATPPCEQAGQGKSTFDCDGFYLFLNSSQVGEKTVLIDLPPPSVWITLSGCSPSPPENICKTQPKLLLTGEEPLPNEKIIRISAIVGENTYTCEGEVCEIDIGPTYIDGTPIEFWAESSFGDSSEHFTALVRILESGVPETPGAGGWYVDVLSSQWRGGQVESCAQIWQAFPPIGGPPFWLSTPEDQVFLSTGEPLQYLAGRLIYQGLVDASECLNNGLLDNGYADACGLSKARPMVDLWQNQFDPRILTVAQETGLPAQLLKNLFAQESQFWPGVFRVAKEYGLGQLTDIGADTVLLWNDSFYNQFCPLVLADEACVRGYLRLDESERAILRGALAVQANADCSNCSTGIDLTHANFSVMLFAQGILANCNQVAQTVFNATQSTPGSVSKYEELWRFTLANYNAGPGCLAFAIHTAWTLREPLDWEHIAPHLTEPCRGAIAYVDLISR